MTSYHLPLTDDVFEHQSARLDPQTTGSSETVTNIQPGSEEEAIAANAKSDPFSSAVRNGAPRTLHAGAWRWEILSLCLALASLVILIAILAAYDRRPTPAWAGGLTLNTITSIVSLTYRFGLMVPVATCISQLAWVGFAQGEKPLHDAVRYDWASRSPWGSAALLFRTPSKSLLAILGSVLVLLSLIVGPFFQQSVAYFDLSVKTQDGVAYAYISLTYGGQVTDYIEDDRATRGDKAPFSIRSAIYTGLMSSASSALPEAPYVCPWKADCYFPEMHTLAFEMQCIDRAHDYSLQCSQQSTQWPDSRFPNHCSVRGPLTLAAAYDPSRTMSIQATTQNASTLDESIWDLPAASNRSVDIAFLNIEWVVARGLLTSNSSGVSRYVSRNSRIEARQCIVYNVLATIEPKVTSNGRSERLLDTTMVGARNQALYYDAGRPAGMTIDGYLDFLAAMGEPLGDGDVLQRNATQYGPAVFRLLEASSQTSNRTWPPPQQPLGKTKPTTANITSVTEHALYNAINYVNLAMRINHPIPKADGKGSRAAASPKIAGIVMMDKSHVKVRWAWLTFPAVLLLGAVVLLWSTVVQCNSSDAPLWKDNPLAILMHTDWRRPNDSTVLKTTRAITTTSRGLSARYLGNSGVDGPAMAIGSTSLDQDEKEVVTRRWTGWTAKDGIPFMRQRKMGSEDTV